MRCISALLISGFFLIILSSLKNPSPTSIGFDNTIHYFKSQSEEFAVSTDRLQSAVAAIQSNDSITIIKAREALKDCRLQYKNIEFFIEYFFKSSGVFFNGPAKFEIEEPYIEWQTPIGLQVMESLLFEKDIASKKGELLEQAEAVNSSAKDLKALVYAFKADDKQILESLRLELIRIYTLGITGFDAPFLKSGVRESYVALAAIQTSLQPFMHIKGTYADSVRLYLNGSLNALKSANNFDRFDRLGFLTSYGLPLQKHLGLFIQELHLLQNSTQGILNYNAPNIFSLDAINVNAISNNNIVPNASLIELGEKLFFETALSGNNKISCATCHQPQLHFSDALPQSPAFNGHSHVGRNATSLLYAGYQLEQFWDGRAKSLEEQIIAVMQNPVEMNGDYRVAIKQLYNKEEYLKLFKKSFPSTEDSTINLPKIATSIAAFVRTLNPRNSPFDRYMEGDKAALTEQQKHGFNLFMGKAQCGTCHFAPLFNGLVPPLYNLTELEVLGTTKTDDFLKPQSDTDRGRYNIFPIDFYQKAFKTPTVRNVSATAPYMHNGAYKSLEKVVEFYNKGGGKGIGLEVNNQTLSSAPLNLTGKEISDIVSFMRALEDKVPYKN